MAENFSAEKNNKQGIICIQPFTAVSFFVNGDSWNCLVPYRPKYSIGNIKQKSIAEMWNSKTARWIRRKMYAGEWQDICNPTCDTIVDYVRSNKFIKYKELEKYKFEGIELLSPQLIEEIRTKKNYLRSPPACLQLDNSSICNLNCIMCAETQELCKDDLTIQKKLWTDLKNYLPGAKGIYLAGRGEPLARPDTRELLKNYKGSAKFHIVTNGLLLPKYWEQIKHQRFIVLNISIDAATKETYEKIRRGGKWEDLLKTLELVKQNRDKFESILINMTVMRSNYQEIPKFIDLAESCGFTCLFRPVGRGEHNGENFFELNDTAVIKELRNIVIKEGLKKRNINIILQGDFLAYLNLPPNINFRNP